MPLVSKQKLEEFFVQLEESEGKMLEDLLGNHLDDEMIEIFVDHLEEFYGIEDDEELGSLAQMMITGFLAGRLL